MEKIINQTKKTIVSEDFTLCNTQFKKARGLMFSKKKDLLFTFDKEKNISLHMLCVFFPIWAVYLNSDKKVTFIKKLLPFIGSSFERARYILETPGKPDIDIGDLLDW